jgi:hypothetical protein
MRRAVFILLWGILFLILPTVVLATIFFIHYHDPDPPTELLFVAVTFFSPVSGLIGITLGLLRKLPGTK